MKKESGFIELRTYILVILLFIAAGSGMLCGQEIQQTPSVPAQGPQQNQRIQAETETAGKAKPELARFVIDANPLMWILSGIPDQNNNRSIFFDIGIQFNILPDVALRINPSFSVGVAAETAFSDSPEQFLEVDFPLSLFCFPFPDDTYLDMLFFGISVVAAYHKAMETDTDTVFVSIGALLEIGYQLRLSNHLSITPSIGVSRMFPKLIDGAAYSAPNFNLYSPWISDTPVAPRARISVGFWI
jgi:hypothetical protein